MMDQRERDEIAGALQAAADSIKRDGVRVDGALKIQLTAPPLSKDEIKASMGGRYALRDDTEPVTVTLRFGDSERSEDE